MKKIEVYVCEECLEPVRDNEELIIHNAVTGHQWYYPKELADRGLYGWADRVHIKHVTHDEDLKDLTSIMKPRNKKKGTNK